jgi:RHS repeat-associated protein
MNDGKGTETLSYDQGSEHRGLMTGVSDSQSGSFSATYNANGDIATQSYPNGMTATTTTNEADQGVGVTYTKTTNCASACTWFADQIVPSIHGQWLSQSSSLSSQSYTYDASGRLSWVYDTLSGQCATRQYGYDADSNRTNLTSRSPNADGSCNTVAGGASQTWTYDAADRITTPGYAFDVMGRITGVPAADAGGNSEVTTYFANDMVNSISEAGVTDTASLDPIRRIRQWATSTDSSKTETLHYSADGDSPSWVAESSSGSTWTRNVPAVGGLVGTVDQSGAVTLQIVSLHGDVVATASASQSATSLTATFEQTEFGQPRSQTTARYGWLGGYARAKNTTSGLITMGMRLYSPSTGRFLQTDSVFGGSANAYDYAAQDPINNLDLGGDQLIACRGGTLVPLARIYGGRHQIEGRFQYQCANPQFLIDFRLRPCVQGTTQVFPVLVWGARECALSRNMTAAIVLFGDTSGTVTTQWRSCIKGELYRSSFGVNITWYADTDRETISNIDTRINGVVYAKC